MGASAKSHEAHSKSVVARCVGDRGFLHTYDTWATGEGHGQSTAKREEAHRLWPAAFVVEA